MAKQQRKGGQQKKGNSASKSGKSRKSASAKSRQAELARERRRRRRTVSVILFAVAVLLLVLSAVKGSSVWNSLHSAVLGLFGFCAFLLPFAIGYIAVLFAKQEDEEKMKVGKIVEVGLLSLLIGSFLHLMGDPLYYTDIWGYFTAAYRYSPGGVFGSLLGEPLWAICGKDAVIGRICAMIIVAILMFIFIMLVTETPLLKFLAVFKKPGEAISSRRSRVVYDEDVDDEPEEESYEPQIDEIAPKKTGRAKNKRDNSSLTKLSGSVLHTYEGDERIEDKADFEMITEIPYESVEADSNPSAKHETVKVEQSEIEEEGQKQKFRQFLEILNSDGSVAESEEEFREDKPKVQDPVEAPKMPLIEIEDEGYNFPPVSLLSVPQKKRSNDSDELQRVGQTLIRTLDSFNVKAEITDISRGPSVTRFELKPAPGVRVNRITNLADDIALSLASSGVRIEAPIPGKSAVGIEVPNRKSDMVNIREVIDSNEFSSAKSDLSVALGKDIAGKIIVADIAKMPHVLIAGTTGSGKSVCINSIIISILYKSSPKDVKLLMVDPKVVELGVYNGIPHLLVPVVTDPKKAAGALGWAVTEMLRRYKLFSEKGVREINGYNNRVSEDGSAETLPQVVIIIDELADLMMVAPGEVEDYIMRLAQMARAAGMHLIIATQRPTVDVITGTIKSNIPSRIAFAVSDGVHSRTILDATGAEKLIGRGDMLFNPVGSMKPSRIQGCFVSDSEIQAVVDYVKNSEETVEYDDDVMQEIEKQAAQDSSTKGASMGSGEAVDEMLSKAIECVVEAGQASTSYLQRKLGLGYARAARLMDDMESRGIIGEYNGSKPREVLITKQQYFEMQNSGAMDE